MVRTRSGSGEDGARRRGDHEVVTIYAFREFELDDAAGELRRGADPVPLQPKAYELLVYLLRHRDRAVSKDELLDTVWGDAMVTEGSITRAVNLIRSAVGDAGREQAVIRTLPRRGYRFCADVTERTGDGAAEPEALARARALLSARAWAEAAEAFREADEAAPLAPVDRERLGWALLWAGELEPAHVELAQAESGYAAAGDVRGAARMALQLARHHYEQREMAPSTGFMARAVRLLEDQPESPEHALLAWMRGRAQADAGQIDEAFASCQEAVEIGRRVGSADAVALGLLMRGHILQTEGRAQEAVALLDEAAAAATSGDLGIMAAGTIYCSVIWASRNRGDWDRASQWTEMSSRWCERVGVDHFPGLCRMHRGEVLRLRAEFEEAEREILRACDDLLIHIPSVAGDAFYELGEVRLRRGDLSGAREAFQRAVELGMEPEPGLARLRLEEGDREGALRGLRRALASPRLLDAQRRFVMWTGQVSVAIAAGETAEAARAVAELERFPELWAAPAHRAMATGARAELALAEGRIEQAVAELREAAALWRDVGAPWEAARQKVILAEALGREGDVSSAQMELEAARAAFERLGATLDAERAGARLAGLAAERGAGAPADRAERTFLFTDIVGSTRLAELLGDEDWEALRRWYHRTLQDCFRDHGGEVVGPHEGDGFFVAFAEPSAAVECAVAIQRRLASHRAEHGFAPQVRIGAHTAEALRRGGDYAGLGVHVAARVAQSAAGGEIRVSRDTWDRCGAPPTREEARLVDVSPDSDPVRVHTLEWRDSGARRER